jgi:crotonobetainyl-CoA:carnitine CoA-transferase CaiB-like acyl-CoA transferase
VFCEKVLGNKQLAGDPRFDTNPKRNANRAELQAIIHHVFTVLETDEVERRLEEAQIANGRMNDMAGLWSHPQLKARGRWRTVASPAGDIEALLPPGRNGAFDYRMGPIPAVGEHTQAILRELGVPPDSGPAPGSVPTIDTVK